MPGRVEKWQRRRVCNHGNAAELIGGGGREVAKGAQGLDSALGGMDHKPDQHFTQWVKLKLEAGHDPQAARSAAQPPKEIRMFLGGGGHQSAIGQYHPGTADIVTGETVLAHQPAGAAAQCEPTHTGTRYQPSRRCQPFHRRRPIDVAP